MAIESIPIWSIPPDWRNGMMESLEWLTSVLTSASGAEQRFAVRLSPRQSFEMDFTVHSAQRTYFDQLVLRGGGPPMYVPLWFEPATLTADTGIGANVLNCDTTFSEFKTAKFVFLRGANSFDYEVGEIATQTSSTISLTANVAKLWKLGTRVYPMKKCQIQLEVQANRKADKAYTSRIKFTSLEPNKSIDTRTVNRYFNYPVLEEHPNEIEDLSYTYSRVGSNLDNLTGIPARYDVHGVVGQQFAFLLKGKQKLSELRALFYLLQGRRGYIWLPTFFNDLIVTSAIALTDTTITVKRCGFTDFGGPGRNRQDIVIETYGGTRYYRRIVDSANVGGGVSETIEIDSALGVNLAVSQIKRISFMALSRLDQDTIEFTHHTDTKGATGVNVVFRDPDRNGIEGIVSGQDFLACGQPSPNHVIVTNNSLTVQGGNVPDPELAQTCEVAQGRFWFEVLMDSGATIDACAIGVATLAATASGINTLWTGGAGYNTQGRIDSNGSTVSSLNGNLSPGSVLGIAVDTINHRIYFYPNLSPLDAGHIPASLPSFQPAIGNFGTLNFAALGTDDYLLTILFKPNTADKFTLRNSGFTYTPPMGYGYGWNGVVPNAATYLGLDPGASVNMVFGVGNHAGIGSGTLASGTRSLTPRSAGKLYFEFMKEGMVWNGSWAAIIDAAQSLTGGLSGTHGKGLVGAGGSLGNLIDNAIGSGAVDLGAKLLWIRPSGSSNWNNNPLADPATGVGGASLASLTPPFYFGMGNAAPGGFGAAERMLFISNPSYLKYAVPAGFTGGW